MLQFFSSPLDAGPAENGDTCRVCLFSVEPTLPACTAHHTHVVGRLHVCDGPTRLAHVDRPDRLYEGASRCSRGSQDICACSVPWALVSHGVMVHHRCFIHMLVRIFVRSLRLARGSKAHHGHKASSHDKNNNSVQRLKMPHTDSFD